MLRKLMMRLGLGWIGGELRAVAEGKRGPRAAAIYQALKGKKTLSGLGLALVCVALVCVGEVGAETWITGIAGTLLVSVGLLDRDWRQKAPDVLQRYRLYLWLRDHSADVALVLAVAAGALTTCSIDTASLLARVHLTCGQAQTGLGVLSAMLVHLGLQAEARLAAPPAAPVR